MTVASGNKVVREANKYMYRNTVDKSGHDKLLLNEGKDKLLKI